MSYRPVSGRAGVPAHGHGAAVPPYASETFVVPYQGESQKQASPRFAPRRPVLHALGVALFLLTIMSGTVACAYYILSCYGFY